MVREVYKGPACGMGPDRTLDRTQAAIGTFAPAGSADRDESDDARTPTLA